MTTTRLAALLFTDIVGSTQLKSKIGSADYARLLARYNEMFESSLREMVDAQIIKHTGDGYFAAFTTASDAVRFALSFQQQMLSESWDGDHAMRTRVGIHIGEVVQMDMAGRSDIVGLSADLTARIMSLATGGQILLTRGAFDDARQFVGKSEIRNSKSETSSKSESVNNDQPSTIHPQLRWIAHGPYLFKGSDEPLDVFEVGIEGASPLSRPPDSEKVKRVVPHDQEPTLGWRPAIGLEIPNRPGWKLDRKLGDGGFGEVWLGVHGKLKHERRVFKFCFDVDRLRSFKRELTLFRLLREALGERDDIATLYEVQLNEPPFYLESEYTEGGNLLEWAERKGGIDTLPLNDRLEMVAKVADAVAAAHSVGVLHKDIKPSNILIHERDGQVQPRLADFGIGILSDRTQLQNRAITETGFTVLTQNESSRTGTRMYSPPESLLSKPFTTQGDVYALGVLLYQMVVADLTRPLAPGWEREVSDELLREGIAVSVEGNLGRRLESPRELAEQIRTLDQRRRTRQLELNTRLAARRRRRWVIATSISAAALIVLWLLTAATLVRERGLRNQAENAQAVARRAQSLEAQQRQVAQTAQAVAEAEARKASQVNKFLEEILSSSDPHTGGGHALTVREAVEKAAESISRSFADQPQIAQALHVTVGRTFGALGVNTKAVSHLRTARELAQRIYGVGAKPTVTATQLLAHALSAQEGEASRQESIKLLTEAVESLRKTEGPNSPEVLEMLGDLNRIVTNDNVSEAGDKMLFAMMALFRGGGRSGDDVRREVGEAINDARQHFVNGNLLEARKAVRRVADQYVTIAGTREHVADVLAYIAEWLGRRGDWLAVEPLLLVALDLDVEVNGRRTDHSRGYYTQLAHCRYQRKDFVAAEQSARDGLELGRALFGPDSSQTGMLLFGVAQTLHAQKRLQEAAKVYEAAQSNLRQDLNDSDFLKSREGLAQCYTEMGEYEAATDIYRQTVDALSGASKRHLLLHAHSDLVLHYIDRKHVDAKAALGRFNVVIENLADEKLKKKWREHSDKLVLKLDRNEGTTPSTQP